MYCIYHADSKGSAQSIVNSNTMSRRCANVLHIPLTLAQPLKFPKRHAHRKRVHSYLPIRLHIRASAPERPRAPHSAPERPRAPQSGTEHPKTIHQSGPQHPRAPQRTPERPRASQSAANCPRPTQNTSDRHRTLERSTALQSARRRAPQSAAERPRAPRSAAVPTRLASEQPLETASASLIPVSYTHLTLPTKRIV